MARSGRCSPRRCGKRHLGPAASPDRAAVRRPGRRSAAARGAGVKLADHGIAAQPEQIVTTVGATQALDIVTRTLLRAGDSVLVDEPGWSVEYARLAALGMRVLPVPRGARRARRGGDAPPDRGAAAGDRPRLYVTVSVLHNPTGASLGAGMPRTRCCSWPTSTASTSSRTTPTPTSRRRTRRAWRRSTRCERTIYISGFSKILTPNWRVGYLAAPPALVDRFVDTKLLSTLTTPGAGELALAHCLEQGLLRRHAERVVQRLDAARARTVRLAEAHGCRFAAEPRGLFGWVDVGVDTERLAHAMLDDWLLAPRQPVPRAAAADDPDADQFRDLAGRALLEGACRRAQAPALAVARDARGYRLPRAWGGPRSEVKEEKAAAGCLRGT